MDEKRVERLAGADGIRRPRTPETAAERKRLGILAGPMIVTGRTPSTSHKRAVHLAWPSTNIRKVALLGD